MDVDRLACQAALHNSLWAYDRHGCRCPATVERKRQLWRDRSAKQPRGSRGRGSEEVSKADREAAVSRLTTAGLSARDIAVRLRIAPMTVHRIRKRLRGAA